MHDKIIVTNRGSFIAKYTEAGWRAIQQAIDALILADRIRGISSRLLCLDLAADMRSIGAPVKLSNSPRQNKDAIDAIYRALSPDYLMILGATDVLPHQNLINLADTDDSSVWSDLPYACDAEYSRNSSKFIGPTRVVSRLPDLVGADDPAYLIKLLHTAARYRQRDLERYLRYFGLSADVWQSSSRSSLLEIFGDHQSLLLSPPDGPQYPPNQLQPLSHFINCHGDSLEPTFYGEDENGFPEAMSTRLINGRISNGTVVAAECCYGAQLYNSFVVGTEIPICQSYLLQGAYAFFGSSTIAYGLEVGNGAADLICRYFLLNILQGASIGRAALMARQQYVSNVDHMDPIDLKTLSQFTLLGDPSIQPVRISPAGLKAKGSDSATAERFARGERRSKLRSIGKFLENEKPIASKRLPPRATEQVISALRRIVSDQHLSIIPRFNVFEVEGNPTVRRSEHQIWYYVGVASGSSTQGRLQRYLGSFPEREFGGPAETREALLQRSLEALAMKVGSSRIREVRDVRLQSLTAIVARVQGGEEGRLMDYRIYQS